MMDLTTHLHTVAMLSSISSIFLFMHTLLATDMSSTSSYLAPSTYCLVSFTHLQVALIVIITISSTQLLIGIITR